MYFIKNKPSSIYETRKKKRKKESNCLQFMMKKTTEKLFCKLKGHKKY